MACVIVGVVPAADAFAGFGHPAVITVACVLVLSQGLQNTGAVDWLARSVIPRDAGRLISLTALIGLGALLSGFMNNVGAMALLMPVAVQLAQRLDLTAGQVLMPLAFGTILGGMTTLIGTPPNLIVSGFRAEAGFGAFTMFDFAPVGVAVAVVGVIFVAVVGWRLVPARKSATGAGFETGSYLVEVLVPAKSKAVGMTLRAFEREIEESGAQIVGLVRKEVHITAPHGGRRIHAEDVLTLLSDVDALTEALSVFSIKLSEQGAAAKDDKATAVAAAKAGDSSETSDEDGDKGSPRDEEMVLRELAVLPGSTIVGRSASDLHLRTRYGLNLLAVSREGHLPQARLRTLALKSGDLLLMEGPAEVVNDFINETGCVPLSDRELRIPDNRMAMIAGAIMLGAIGIVTAGLLPASAAFALGVLVSMVTRTVPPRQVYTSIDWPVIVLLAALIPVAGAMHVTGCGRSAGAVSGGHGGAGQPHRGLGGGSGHHHVPVGCDEQRGDGGGSLPYRHRHCRETWRQPGQLSDGGGDWGVLCVSDPDRAPEQHPDPWAGRLWLWRLLETGVPARGAGGCYQHSDAAVRLAAVSYRASAAFRKGDDFAFRQGCVGFGGGLV